MRSCFPCLALALVASQASCQKQPERLPVTQVRGKVLHHGQPAAGARVGCYPLDDSFARKPHAQVGADGSFQLSTYELGDGAPAGRYGVTVVWPGPNPRSNGVGDEEIEGPDRLGGRYADPRTSKWRIEVGRQPLELAPFIVE